MQHNQVFVIQVSSDGGNKPQLALPAPPDSLLPSEVKYSASLVNGLAFAHLLLGAVLFLLGVLGSWVEPETCWSGAGVWAGLAAECCGVSGLLAHRLWYKNFSIKTFLVTSVASVIISVLAFILSIYAIVNRHKYFLTLVEQKEQYPWFQPYGIDNEHRLTMNVSANLVVGFVLELGVALWSVKVGWRGVRSPDFTAARHSTSTHLEEEPGLESLRHHHRSNGQQVPLAAIYQLLQTHPELLSTSNKNMMGAPWEEHPTHRSMDYQERVSRFLSHAIEDQNHHSFPRSLSTVNSDNQGSSSPTGSSSGGRGSPADTLPILPDNTKNNSEKQAATDTLPAQVNTHSERKPKQMEVAPHPNNIQTDRKPKLSNSELLRLKRSENKARAPVPKHVDNKKLSEHSNENEVKNKLNEANSKKDTNVKINGEKRELKSDETNIKPDKHEHKISEEKHKSITNDSQTKIDKHKENTTHNNEKSKSESKPKDLKTDITNKMHQPSESKQKNEQSLEKIANNKNSSDKQTVPNNNKEGTHKGKDLKDKTMNTNKTSTIADNTTKPEELHKNLNSKNSATESDNKKQTKVVDESNKKESKKQGTSTEVKKQSITNDENIGKVTVTSTTTIEQLGLTDIKPPCEFQDT
ncbi:hypothetical protein Pmani_005263 [Petrolisthes manimaculis]|uniref:Uncharacterized protein n=1 Tax=Petrolisthes manimaculis TaxID=1843537 RepID=A0AAE1UGT8_9EUCA|nr:hypothetical protein Pmani_005263 [Petrolisthes manimaculis]